MRGRETTPARASGRHTALHHPQFPQRFQGLRVLARHTGSAARPSLEENLWAALHAGGSSFLCVMIFCCKTAYLTPR